MDETVRARRADLILMLAIIAVAAVGLVLALQLPPSRFDPLGPRSFPIGICVLLIVLALVGLLRLHAGRELGRAETSLILGVGEGGEESHERYPWLAVAIFAGVGAYAIVLQWTPLDFFWATAGFVTLAGLVMGRSLSPRNVVISLAVGFGAAAFLTYLFRHLLVVSLP